MRLRVKVVFETGEKKMSPRVLLPDGSTAFKAILDPTDIRADGQKNALQLAGTDLGQDATQISTMQVLNPGSDDNALAPAASIPTMRRTTIPRFNTPITRLRTTTRD